jgi:hypothetical protein
MAAITYVITTGLPPVLAGVFIVVGLLGTGWLTFRSMRSAPTADDFGPVEDAVVDLYDVLEVDDDLDRPSEELAG